jgi:hypothetical protein
LLFLLKADWPSLALLYNDAVSCISHTIQHEEILTS